MSGIALPFEIPGGSSVNNCDIIESRHPLHIPGVEGLIVPIGTRGHILKFIDANVALVHWEEPAVDTLKEIEAFLAENPSEIITLILEDYVQAPNGLTNVFNESGLLNYWFPVSKMPQKGQDWPLVSDMVASNQRLIVFTSMSSKQDTEGIAYQWNFMVENQYGDGGMEAEKCSNRIESSPLDDTSRSLVLVNYFPSIPVELTACEQNSQDLMDMLNTCYSAASNRWANFVAVDFYKPNQDPPSAETERTQNATSGTQPGNSA